jgi:type I restriction enzyme S subunit
LNGGVRRISASDYVEWTKKLKPQEHDVIVVRRCSSGDSAVVPRNFECAIGQNLVVLRANGSRVHPSYLRWIVQGPDWWEQVGKFINVGAVFDSLKCREIPNFELMIPPLSEQKAIASLLAALDDLIELLREANTTLDGIAQALFKSWFVDFDPIRAKQQGLGPDGMGEAMAALFPDGFEEGEHGSVPKGWNHASLGEMTSYLSRGISPKYAEAGGVLVLNQKCIRDFIVDTSKARRHDSAQRKIDGRELQIGDILVNSTGVGTLGRVAQVLALDERAIVDSHVTVVRAGSELSWNYLGLAMMRKQPEIEELGEGTTGQTELSRGKLASLKLLVPPKSVLQGFDDVTEPLRHRFAANLAKAQTLATLRDTLLPRLISGQLRLLNDCQPEVEAILEEIS